MPKHVNWERREQIQRQWQDIVLAAYEGRVRYHREEDRWYSRHPHTGEWVADRSWGRRLKILNDLVLDVVRSRQFVDRHEEDYLRSLCGDAGRYRFLKALAQRLWDAPNPGYGTETDETIDQ